MAAIDFGVEKSFRIARNTVGATQTMLDAATSPGVHAKTVKSVTVRLLFISNRIFLVPFPIVANLKTLRIVTLPAFVVIERIVSIALRIVNVTLTIGFVTI